MAEVQEKKELNQYRSDQIIEQLAKGFTSLISEFKQLREQHRQLDNQLSWAKQQYLEVTKTSNPATASKCFRDFLNELDVAGVCHQKEDETYWLLQLSQSSNEAKRARARDIQVAENACTELEFQAGTKYAKQDVHIWAGHPAGIAESLVIEQDFTTSGIPGSLGCPFAVGKMSSSTTHRGSTTPRSSGSRGTFGHRSKRLSFHDPIRAELAKPEKPPSEVSGDGSMPLCPIRFLDQHSPEEVARYFEEHQHELPKSHQVCVKRFQENEDALRNLDSKYGNIVSMVKDLGQVHQPMLPKAEDIAVESRQVQHERGLVSVSKVQDWAQNIDQSVDQDHENERREQRFDRPLKEIRVGESPSRPWGITVPGPRIATADYMSKTVDSILTTRKPGSSVGVMLGIVPPTCPFSGMQNKQKRDSQIDTGMPPSEPLLESVSQLPPAESEPEYPAKQQVPLANTKQSQFVFNGPVFFGYPIDQAREALKQFESHCK